MTGKPKRGFTDFEKDYLTKFYENENKYPNIEVRSEIAKYLDRSETQINTWFRHKRRVTGESKNWSLLMSRLNGPRKRGREDEIRANESSTSTLLDNNTNVNDTINSSVLDEFLVGWRGSGSSSHVDVEALPTQKDVSPLPVLQESQAEDQLNAEQKVSAFFLIIDLTKVSVSSGSSCSAFLFIFSRQWRGSPLCQRR